MLYVTDSQIGFASKVIHLIPNFWVNLYRGYVGTVFWFGVFSQQWFQFIVRKGNAPPFGCYVSQALVNFGANNFIVSEVSFERFEKLDLFFGFSCFTLRFGLSGVRLLKEFIYVLVRWRDT